MRLRTKLIITGVTIVILPLALTAAAFVGIGTLMTHDKQNAIGRGIVTDNNKEYQQTADDIFEEVEKDKTADPYVLENSDYLDNLNQELEDQSAFILVRKDDKIYYNGSGEDVTKLFENLPAYGYSDNPDSGVFYNDGRKLIKQMDFTFEDGSKGSFFVVMTIRSLISSVFLIHMCVAMLLILLFTSLMLTSWIKRALFKPIGELSNGMQHIKDGNFDYMLPTNDEKDEIGEMYRNYEDMRLRLKESADEKIEHEKQNKELISNISHDLKTPITAIKGYAEGLIEGVADTPEKQMKYVRTIYNKANDMNNLINELTLYSSIDNNRIPYNFHKINVADYFGDCIEEVGMDMESKNIKLNYANLTSPDTVVIADPEQLKRVVNNIIGNSVKYLDRDDGSGQIDIRILDEIDSIRVEIEDNGKGIAQKDIPNIFDRFYRTDSSRNSRHGGSGIGLSIVKKIIEDHGGYIWATSHEGEGTCMHFVLRKYIDDHSGTETDTTAHEA
ncbi:MAG: HAMP domain-containing histidine kinase [Butyrivibrio sp.]|nr:HAMP domain-containing histidine kinase [Butyrivibrio sp.]